MPTVNKQIAEQTIERNGYYHPDDARILAVVRYQNQFDGTDSYAVCFRLQQLLGYIQSRSCINLQILWHCIVTTDQALDIQLIIDLYAAPGMKVST